jgi:hypothetical protein
MTRTEKPMLWVVYRMTMHGKASGMSAVCEQAEWDAMELERPGYHTLILGGIANEGEAERLARSSSAREEKASGTVSAVEDQAKVLNETVPVT